MPDSKKSPGKRPKKVEETPITPSIKKLYTNLKDLKLNSKQILFLVGYASNGFNATQAYKDAGYLTTNDQNASVCGCLLLRDAKVREGLRRYLEEVLENGKVKLSKQLFDGWFTLAFYDPSVFINEDGAPAFTSWDQVPAEQRKCIESIETKAYGKDGLVTITSIKLADRKFYMDKLDKYIGMTRELKELTIVSKVTKEQEKELQNIFEGELK